MFKYFDEHFYFTSLPPHHPLPPNPNKNIVVPELWHEEGEWTLEQSKGRTSWTFQQAQILCL